LDKRYSWEDVVIQELPDVRLVLFPRPAGTWAIQTVKKGLNSFESRLDLPKGWAGLVDKELQDVTGVKDATFCHRNAFLAVALSKEGALELAKLALR
jgi:uncharacterized UPF0160 family protein